MDHAEVACKQFQCACDEQHSFGLTNARPSFKVKGAAWAEDAYPTRAIRMIVPFGAGGPTDTLGRALAERMSDQLERKNHEF